MRVYLLAPDLRTRGGFEAQMSALAAGLAAEGVQVFVAIREAVAPDHPYWQRMQQAGVTLSAPPAWLARLLDPPLAWRQASMRLLLALCVPLLLLAALADRRRRGRSWARSWQGAVGWLHGRFGRWLFADGLSWWLWRRLDRARRRWPPDLVDVQHSMLPGGLVYAADRGLPLIYTEYGAPDEGLASVWAGLCPVIGRADAIIGRAQASLDGLQRLCGPIPPGVVVPNAVTSAPADDALRPTDPAGPAPGPVIVTAVGRLAPEKGPDLLLTALRILHEQEMAGESPAGALRVVFAGDGPLRSGLQAQAAAWGLAPYVEFSGAFDDLAPIMQRTDIVAHPTRNDGRSVSVLEAMAWAKPVVATRVGGLPELIEEGVNGLLTPPDDPAALAAALHRLAQDPDLRRRMGQAGRARFLAGDFTVAAMVKATLAVYRQIIVQKSAVGSHP